MSIETELIFEIEHGLECARDLPEAFTSSGDCLAFIMGYLLATLPDADEERLFLAIFGMPHSRREKPAHPHGYLTDDPEA